jgi:hypothetical protein
MIDSRGKVVKVLGTDPARRELGKMGTIGVR